MTEANDFESTSLDSRAEGEKSAVLTLAKGAGIALVGRVLSRGLLLMGQAILARALGRADYGLFSIGWSVLQISLFASPIGLQHGVIQFGARAWGEDALRFRRILQQTIFMALVSGLFWGAALYILSPQLSIWFGKPGLELVLRGTAIAMFLSVVIRVAAAATRVSRRVQFSALAEDFLPAFLLTFGALLLTMLWPGGLFGGIASVVIAYALSALAALGFLVKLFPGALKPIPWDKTLFKEITAFSVPVALAGTLVVLIQWVTRLVLGYLRPEAEVGVYQAASQMASVLVMVQASTSAIFTPMIARMAGRGETERLDALYKVATKWSVYLSAPVLLVMAVYPALSLDLVFGSAYTDGAAALVVMSLGQLVNIASGSVGPLMVTLNRQKQFLQIQFAALVLTLVLNFWWIPEWGVTGAAVGNSIGIAVANLVSMIYLKRATGLWPYDRRYWKGLLAGALTLLALLVLAWFLPSGLFVLFVAAALALALFFLVLWRMGLDEEDRQFLAAVRQRIGL